ncbi:hypothetical protein KRE40_11155 [Elizabethkingia meningoseptica]|uniref:Uncharacterized protein n=3 Tax=Elizabethkingia meningoseptica TaxID=238 RepID=A0A1V3TWE0_ELIME|nr:MULTISPECIES: hypothetical protein [Elizabethkingia]AQX11757.1 hypothetical protein BBD35_04910 [Elizabethkingia meningoseptica]MBG0513200.1 hypothetical protein [Elizabethkingia meningoseptica]MDE5434556.1 hypothetical protein [Elizabethkingia meningoseptica]MDE5439237.1 hypothetical protein [Elizabethkingia meningoseptica]MDE5451075.1 hypothetical protein [Elizabethkingia meningoseptica]
MKNINLIIFILINMLNSCYSQNITKNNIRKILDNTIKFAQKEYGPSVNWKNSYLEITYTNINDNTSFKGINYGLGITFIQYDFSIPEKTHLLYKYKNYFVILNDSAKQITPIFKVSKEYPHKTPIHLTASYDPYNFSYFFDKKGNIIKIIPEGKSSTIKKILSNNKIKISNDFEDILNK